MVSPPSRQELRCPDCHGTFVVHCFHSDSPDEPHLGGRCPLCLVFGTAPTGTQPHAAFFEAQHPPGYDGDLQLALSSVCLLCETFLVDREADCRGCGEVPAPRKHLVPDRAQPLSFPAIQARRERLARVLDKLAREMPRVRSLASEQGRLAEEWLRNAYRAVQAGSDDLAREALARKNRLSAASEALSARAEKLEQCIEKLREVAAALRQQSENTKKQGENGAKPAVLRPEGPLASLLLRASPTPLLSDRLRVCLPDGVRLAARHVGGLMGMDISMKREQHAGVSAPAAGGPSRVLFEALDPFAYVDGSFPALAIRRVKDLSEQIEVPFSLDPSGVGDRSVLLLAGSLAQNRRDILVGEVMTPHPDGTLLLVRAYTDSSTASRDREDVFALVRKVAATFEAGPRSLVRHARVERFGPPDAPESLCLALPEGFAWDTDRGPDFVVHTCSYVVPFNVTPLVIKIYLGHHPSRHYQELPRGAQVQTVAGGILGREASWRVISDDGLWMQEVIAPVTIGREQLLLHAFGETTSAEQARYVRDLVGAVYAVS